MDVMTCERPGAMAGASVVDVDELVSDDPSARVRMWELTGRERDVFEAGFMLGHAAAGPALADEVGRLRQLLAQAEHDADRYYAEMCRRPAPRQTDSVPYGDLCRRRGEDDRGARHEAQIDAMFPQFAR
jgi:hypothetical protein